VGGRRARERSERACRGSEARECERRLLAVVDEQRRHRRTRTRCGRDLHRLAVGRELLHGARNLLAAELERGLVARGAQLLERLGDRRAGGRRGIRLQGVVTAVDCEGELGVDLLSARRRVAHGLELAAAEVADHHRGAARHERRLRLGGVEHPGAYEPRLLRERAQVLNGERNTHQQRRERRTRRAFHDASSSISSRSLSSARRPT